MGRVFSASNTTRCQQLWKARDQRQQDYDAKLQAAIKAAKMNGSARKTGKSPAPIFISRRGSKVGSDEADKGGSASWWSWIALGVSRFWQSAQAEDLVFVK